RVAVRRGMACQLEPPGGGGALARRQGTRGVLVREALALFGLGWTCVSGDQHGLGFPVPRRARVDARTLGRRRAPLRESAHDQRTRRSATLARVHVRGPCPNAARTPSPGPPRAGRTTSR